MKKKSLIAALIAGMFFSFDTIQAQTVFPGMVTEDTVYIYTVNDLLVYPNPVTSNARIVLPVASIWIAAVNVIDLNGNVVRSAQYAPGTYNLDVDMSRLPAGLYSVRVSGKGVGFHNLKVVKQ